MSVAPRLGELAASDDQPAITEPGQGSISYGELDALAARVADRLHDLGVTAGARIGIYARRSSDAIAAMLGTLRAGCAYIPVDPRAPLERVADILADARVCAMFVEDRFERGLRDILARGHASPLFRLGSVGLGNGLRQWLDDEDPASLRGSISDTDSRDTACLLYTSGTTGQAKGWMMSRAAIEAHARWCHRFLEPTRADVFANHAQFSFGMSLFDIYSSLGCGARLVLVPEEIRAHGPRVVDLLVRERVTIWFSSPAILSLIGRVGDLSQRDLSALRVVASAGEAFPLSQLNLLRRQLRSPRYFNFWGSTETNVGAHYELPPGGDLEDPPPFGRPCEHYEARLASDDGAPVAPGTVGEWQLRGVGLTSGYWNNPAITAAQRADDPQGGEPWFRTGDLAVELPTGDFRYVGRIGRMVKLRGYRIEPGEIEVHLYRHPSIREASVLPIEGPSGVELVAHVSTMSGARLSIVALKEFCARKLPAYMIPERFEFHETLPRTLRGKIDLGALRHSAGSMVPR